MTMQLKHPFTQQTRELFRDAQWTWFNCCGNNMVELNHTVGRVSNSPVNASPLCRGCHSHVGHSNEEEKALFKKTLKYLAQRSYEFTDEDRAFMDSSAACREALLELSK